MMHFNELVFDERLETIGAAVEYMTHRDWNDLLGQCDMVAFHIVADDVFSTGDDPTVLFSIETSCDGIHWVEKTLTTWVPLGVDRLSSFCLADAGTRPSYALVRIRLRFLCADKAWARVRLYATGRDTGGVPHRLHGPNPSKYHWLQRSGKHQLTDKERAALHAECVKHHPDKECAQYLPFDP